MSIKQKTRINLINWTWLIRNRNFMNNQNYLIDKWFKKSKRRMIKKYFWESTYSILSNIFGFIIFFLFILSFGIFYLSIQITVDLNWSSHLVYIFVSFLFSFLVILKVLWMIISDYAYSKNIKKYIFVRDRGLFKKYRMELFSIKKADWKMTEILFD